MSPRPKVIDDDQPPLPHWCRKVKEWHVTLEENYRQSRKNFSYQSSHQTEGTLTGSCQAYPRDINTEFKGTVSGNVSERTLDKQIIPTETKASGDESYHVSLSLIGDDDEVNYLLSINGPVGGNVPGQTTELNNNRIHNFSTTVLWLVAGEMSGHLPKAAGPISGQVNEPESADPSTSTTGTLKWELRPTTTEGSESDGVLVKVGVIGPIKGKGKIYFRRATGEVLTRLREGMVIYRGDELRIGEGNLHIEVLYPDGSIYRFAGPSRVSFGSKGPRPGGATGITG